MLLIKGAGANCIFFVLILVLYNFPTDFRCKYITFNAFCHGQFTIICCGNQLDGAIELKDGQQKNLMNLLTLV